MRRQSMNNLNVEATRAGNSPLRWPTHCLFFMMNLFFMMKSGTRRCDVSLLHDEEPNRPGLPLHNLQR